MPLSINVGLSRKASKDYQSTGVSINVTAELDQALLAKPDDLQKQIGELFAQAEHALARQADSMGEPQRQPGRGDYDRREPYRGSRYDDREQGGSYGRGYNERRSRGAGSNGGSMTQSQRRAILAIADRMSTDPRLESRDIIGCGFDDLTVRQASELIDHLKSMQSADRRR